MKFPMLPVMQCDEGCGDCCGVVMCKQGEFERVAKYAAIHGVEPKRQGATCPWYQQGKCTVYPVRPGICRLFGHTASLACSRGYNVNVQGELKRRADAFIGNATRCLHEVLGTDWLEVIKLGLAIPKKGKA